MNPVTGEKLVNIGGSEYVMKFTWRGLSEIEQKYGENPNLFDPGIIAHVASIGLRDRYQEMTADMIMDISPPLVPFAKAVQTAIQWAYFGPEGIPNDEGRTVKKNQKAGGSWRRIKTLCRWAWHRLSSGA